MEITNLFPTPIGIDYYPDIENLKDEVPRFFKEITSEENNNKLRFNIFEREGPTVKKFYDFMRNSVNEYAKLINAYAEFDVDSSWVFINEALNPHHHALVPIVSTFYIDAENPEAPKGKRSFSSPMGDLTLLDPRGGVNLYCRDNTVQNPNEPKNRGPNATFNGSGSHNVSPKTGKIIHFPGYVIHYVNLNKTENNRILIGANWERVVDLDKMDPTKPKLPKVLSVGSNPNNKSSEDLLDYFSKKKI